MKTAVVQISAQGSTVLVPGQPGLFVRVYAWSLSALPLDDQVPVFSLVKFQSVLAGPPVVLTDLSGWRALSQYGLFWDLPLTGMRLQRPDAYLVTAIGEGLGLFQADAFDLGGFVNFEIVPG